jgi:hypothetical protein
MLGLPTRPFRSQRPDQRCVDASAHTRAMPISSPRFESHPRFMDVLVLTPEHRQHPSDPPASSSDLGCRPLVGDAPAAIQTELATAMRQPPASIPRSHSGRISTAVKGAQWTATRTTSSTIPTTTRGTASELQPRDIKQQDVVEPIDLAWGISVGGPTDSSYRRDMYLVSRLDGNSVTDAGDDRSRRDLCVNRFYNWIIVTDDGGRAGRRRPVPRRRCSAGQDYGHAELVPGGRLAYARRHG